MESLLALNERAKSFLETPAAAQVQDAFAAKNLEGHRIGSYQIEAWIGAGGMVRGLQSPRHEAREPSPGGRDQGPAAGLVADGSRSPRALQSVKRMCSPRSIIRTSAQIMDLRMPVP